MYGPTEMHFPLLCFFCVDVQLVRTDFTTCLRLETCTTATILQGTFQIKAFLAPALLWDMPLWQRHVSCPPPRTGLFS
jgi:hypothetical protein